MSQIRVALLALSALSLLTSTAFSQAIFAPGQSTRARSNPGGVQGNNTAQTCQTSGGGSRTRANCEVETATVRTEQTITISIEPPTITSGQCESVVSSEFQQRNTIARVTSTLKLAECTAASGAFTVAVRVRDESGEVETLEFSETWQRGDGQDVKFTADYPIGDNVELVGVRVRDLRCTCDTPAGGAPAP